jgi:Mn-dependent DtxR family transcriptional regulator
VKEPTEAVLEAAWTIVEILSDGALRWVDLAAQTEWSDPTLRRASGLLQRAGIIYLDPSAGKWSRVDGVEIPAELLPRSALVKEHQRMQEGIKKALLSIHGEYLKAKQNEPDAWSGPAFARAMQLVCDRVGVPLDPASWGQ